MDPLFYQRLDPAFFYLLLIEKSLFQSTVITLVDEGIKVPGLVRSHILPWDLIENFVVRQDYVTITRRDKKFVQLEVLQDISSTEIEKLVTFSKQQIALTTAEETV